MRKDYRFVRQWVLFFLPSFLICALPDWLGVTQVKPEWQSFRFWFNFFVSWCFFGGLAYLVYALWFNARLEMKNE